MLRVTFYMQRPKFHSGVKGLKALAPLFPHRVPDLDKLLRSTCDALTDAQVIVDDARIVQIKARKVYADSEATGALIYITHTNEGNENE